MSRKEIAKGNSKEVLAKLANFLNKVSPYQDEITNQQASLEENDNKLKRGDITNEEHKVERNKLRDSILFYNEEIEKAIRAYFPNLKLPLTEVSLHEQVIISTHGKFHNIQPYINGDSAVFFKANRIDDDRLVMLRVFKQSPYQKEALEDIFEDKEKYLKIKDRNIIPIEHIENQNYPFYLELEYINGISLDKLIQSGIPMAPSLALKIMLEVAKALSYLATLKIVHGRVRPSKILIDNELKPVISPFEGYQKKSQTGQSLSDFVQELKYLAPELVSGKTELHSQKSDQFSFGIVGLEMLLGKNPFTPDNKRLSIRQILENRRAFFANPGPILAEEIGKLPIDERSKEDLVKLFSTLLSQLPENLKGGRYRKMGDIVDAIDYIRIREEAIVREVRKSYNRCCICVENFTDVFYQELLKNQDIKAIFDQYHASILARNPNIDIDRLRRKRRKMLRTTIHLLLADSPEQFYANFIKGMPQHQGVSQEHYAFYFDTIQGLVKHNDEEWDEEVAEAWRLVREQTIARFR